MAEKNLLINNDRDSFLRQKNVSYLGIYSCVPVYKLEKENILEKEIPFSYYYDKGDSIELVDDNEAFQSIGILYDNECFFKYKKLCSDDHFVLNSIRRRADEIPELIEQSREDDFSYREVLIGILFYGWFFAYALCGHINDEDLFSYSDYLKAICLRNGIDIHDAAYSFTRDDFASILDGTKLPRDYTVLDVEFVRVKDFSNWLRKEITARSKITSIDETTSVLDFFEPETSSLVTDIFINRSYVFHNVFTGSVKFLRNDNSAVDISVEFSLTWDEATTGFSGRYVILKTDAMFYVFNKEICAPCNTDGVIQPLSVAYISKDGTINEIIDRKEFDTEVYTNKHPSMYMLEVSKGFFEENSIHVNDKVLIDQMDNFF